MRVSVDASSQNAQAIETGRTGKQDVNVEYMADLYNLFMPYIHRVCHSQLQLPLNTG